MPAGSLERMVEPIEDFYAVIPAGGIGSRLWPLSRADAPKFLHDLTGSGQTLLRDTWDRLEPLAGRERIAVVTGRAHRAAVERELPGVPDHMAARSPSGVRTTWEFRGRYSFKKKLREMDVNNPGDAAYLAAMGLGSLLAGGAFEESTLDVYIIDIRDPRFEVRSRLLRLY